MNGFSAEVYPYPETVRIPGSRYVVFSLKIAQYCDFAMLAAKMGHDSIIVCGDYVTAAPVEVMQSPSIRFGVVGDPVLPILELMEGKIGDNTFLRVGSNLLSPKIDFDKHTSSYPDYGAWAGEMEPLVSFSLVKNRVYNGSYFVSGYPSNRKHYREIATSIGWLREIGVRGVSVTDEDFNGGSCRFSKAIQSLDRMNFWRCRARSQSVIKNDLELALGDSKCNLVYLDVGNSSLISVSREIHETAIKALKSAGICVKLCITIGYPGETEASLLTTKKWLDSLGLPVVVRTFVATPGMVEYEQGPDWFVITGTHTADFYVDDTDTIYSLPWESKRIDTKFFLGIRNDMVSRFNLSGQN